MKDEKLDLRLASTIEAGTTLPGPALTRPTRAQIAARRALYALLGLAAVGHLAWPLVRHAQSCRNPLSDHVKWTPCGDKFFCTSIDAPLDHHNLTDPRTVSIAVVKMVATPPPGKKRLGSIYINPGGPGGSGTKFAYDAGPAFQVLSGGQYVSASLGPECMRSCGCVLTLVPSRCAGHHWLGVSGNAFCFAPNLALLTLSTFRSPRGINQTLPSVTCFDSAADEYLYAATAPTGLDIPVNFSSIPEMSNDGPDPHGVADHLERQVRLAEASFAAVYARCAAATGDAVGYVGTEAVVRDLDLISKLIDGEGAKINYWGLSYGTVIGQYLTSIIAPERLGRILLDGVVELVCVRVEPQADYDALC